MGAGSEAVWAHETVGSFTTVTPRNVEVWVMEVNWRRLRAGATLRGLRCGRWAAQ